MAGSQSNSNAYASYLEGQLERITSAALVSATFDERLAALERRLAATDENVLASIRLVKSAEGRLADAARAHEHRACGLEREARSAAELSDAQRHLVARLERELDRTRSSVESLEAHLADMRRESAIADKLRADERRAAEQAMGALRREVVDVSARLSVLEGGRTADGAAADSSARHGVSSQLRASEPGSANVAHRRRDSGADAAAPSLVELNVRIDALEHALVEGEARAVERLRTVVHAVDGLTQSSRRADSLVARARTPARSQSPAARADAHAGGEAALSRARARLATTPTSAARARAGSHASAIEREARGAAALWETAARTAAPRTALRRTSLTSDASAGSRLGVGAVRGAAPVDRPALSAVARPRGLALASRSAPAAAWASARSQLDTGRSSARGPPRKPAVASVVSDAPSGKPAVRRASLAARSSPGSLSPSPRSRSSSLRHGSSALSGLHALLHELS